VEGLTKREQTRAKKNIPAAGMTVTGWARTRGFCVETVKNVLYRDWGLGAEVGPVAGEIVAKLREEELV